MKKHLRSLMLVVLVSTVIPQALFAASLFDSDMDSSPQKRQALAQFNRCVQKAKLIRNVKAQGMARARCTAILAREILKQQQNTK